MLDCWNRRYQERGNVLLIGFLGLVVSQETSHQEHTKILSPSETVFFLTFGKTKLGLKKYFAFSGKIILGRKLKKNSHEVALHFSLKPSRRIF